jgi:hypothetical protein
MNIIDKHVENINTFINHKLKFENFFLLGKLDEAKNELKSIEDSFGISLWSIESNLLMEEFVNGSEANWNKLTFFLNKIKNSLYKFIINSNSKRIEAKLHYEGFVNQFLNEINNIKTSTIVKDFLVFKNFNIINFEYEFTHLESVIYISNLFSIIDQYLILIDTFIYNISNSSENDKIIFPFVAKVKDIITNDIRLTNIFNLLNKSNTINLLDRKESLLTCLDNFYLGKFENSLEMSKDGITKEPEEFEYYEIYCKSLINLGLNFSNLGISTIIDDILSNTFNILKFDETYESSSKRLLKICLILMNTNIGKQIYSFLSEIEGIYNKNFITGVLSSTFFSPKNLLIPNRKGTFSLKVNNLLNRHCFKVYNFRAGNDQDFNGKISESESQEIILKAIHLYQKEEYKKLSDILINSGNLDKKNYYYEKKLSLLFNSYLNLNEIEKALTLFGTIFFEDSLTVIKVNYFDLFNKIKDLSNKTNYLIFIEFPILYSLFVKEYDLFEFYEEFMDTYEIFNIKDLDLNDFINKFSLKKVIFFLYNVATIDTIKYSSDYSSISEVEETRIYILESLIKLDTSNKLKYEKEINEIYRINSVRKVLREVDQGRLYIDINKLKELQIKNFKDEFKRFKEIELLSTKQSLIGFNASNVKNWDKEFLEKNENLDSYNSADYLAFKNIYLESRDNFLFSKAYGLDSCLSTRIRHGALKNHIRSVFEKLKLVTSKSKDKYIDNPVWAKQLIYYNGLNSLVQEKLREFSKEIDDYTLFIVEKLIQIQTEKSIKKEEGLFKFFTNDETLFTYYSQNKNLFDSAETTIEMLLTNLVNHALLDVQKVIFNAFSKEIPRKFQLIIETLISDLRDINLPNECQLIPNLIKSSTEIQNELEGISEWFYLNTTTPSTLLIFETILDASVELTNKINPNYKINPIKKFDCETFVVYSSLIFVFNILFNNIIQHSHLPSNELEIYINVETLENNIVVSIRNNVNANFDFSNNIAKLNKIKENWNDHSNIDRSNKEGESGFDKIKRILLYETYSKTEKFNFSFDNNTFTITLYFPTVRLNRDE